MIKSFLIVIGIGLLVLTGMLFFKPKEPVSPRVPQPIWKIRSIDTMKYSRDLAREKLVDKSYDLSIESQVSEIAGTGASHIGIATPYDDEFVPYLKRWVDAARRHNLNVWFRGNLSGWEGWFGYKAITREEHTEGVVKFIKNNPELFENGDIFSSCPECENGGPGDPRMRGDVVEYRKFLISEYEQVNEAFRSIGKNVSAGYHSMNYDVAKLVMDRDTTMALGGIVAIDHYVKDAHQVAADAKSIAEVSGGRVFLGEYGAPIPDLHGDMSETEQAEWVSALLTDLSTMKELVGLNYWTSVGGSTKLWDEDGKAREVVKVVTKFYSERK